MDDFVQCRIKRACEGGDPDLEWLGPSINPGLVLKGEIKLDSALAGTIGKPRYRADVSGRDLELAFASEGLLLPNGLLKRISKTII
jgi:hypothetical protein